MTMHSDRHSGAGFQQSERRRSDFQRSIAGNETALGAGKVAVDVYFNVFVVIT